MKISEFATRYPEFAIDFATELRHQLRVYDTLLLDQLPVELDSEHPYRPGSRGRPNQNQTLTHSQCATCLRVLRNDMYYTVPSMMKRNVVFPHCRACNQGHNATRYDSRSEVIRKRRYFLRNYLAPRCAACGFDTHPSALDIHHANQKTERAIEELIVDISLNLETGRIEALLRHTAHCIPLCSNCHRLLHANVIDANIEYSPPPYHLAALLLSLQEIT